MDVQHFLGLTAKFPSVPEFLPFPHLLACLMFFFLSGLSFLFLNATSPSLLPLNIILGVARCLNFSSVFFASTSGALSPSLLVSSFLESSGFSLQPHRMVMDSRFPAWRLFELSFFYSQYCPGDFRNMTRCRGDIFDCLWQSFSCKFNPFKSGLVFETIPRWLIAFVTKFIMQV